MMLQKGMQGLQSKVDVSTVKSQKELQKELRTLQINIGEKMLESQKATSTNLQNSTRTMAELKEELGKVKEAQDQIKKLDESVKSISSIFSSPKLRGGAGEFTLETILNDTLPGQWESQYYFPDGKAVDAIVRINDKIVCIDSKFPLDRFRAYYESQDEENHDISRKELDNALILNMKEISEKYIRPEENTLNFALMYLPSNKMYYEIFLQDEKSLQKSSEKLFRTSNVLKVYPICPAMLLLYLNSISLGLKGMKIEENAQEIIKRLGNVQKKFDKFIYEYEKVGSSIEKVTKQYNTSDDRFRIFNEEIDRILRLRAVDDGEESTEPLD